VLAGNAYGLGPYRVGELLMIDRNYLARHAAMLLKLAGSTKDRDVAANLVDKAADLKARIDESNYPDVTPVAPDVEPPRAN
jgi:hypothetical protein